MEHAPILGTGSELYEFDSSLRIEVNEQAAQESLAAVDHGTIWYPERLVYLGLRHAQPDRPHANVRDYFELAHSVLLRSAEQQGAPAKRALMLGPLLGIVNVNASSGAFRC